MTDKRIDHSERRVKSCAIGTLEIRELENGYRRLDVSLYRRVPYGNLIHLVNVFRRPPLPGALQ